MSQNGKSSKRRQEDFKKIQSNWDEINWGLRCVDCGNILNKSDVLKNPHKYRIFKYGKFACLECNYN